VHSKTASRRRALVLHSDPIVATGVATLLSSMAGFEVVGLATRHQRDELIKFAEIAVCDELAWRLLPKDATIGIVVLARSARVFDIQAAIEGGVLGHVVLGSDLDEIEGAIRAASHRRRYLCRRSAKEVTNGSPTEALTDRERDVLALVANGLSNKTIGARLDIGVGTVKSHVRSIMFKLRACSRTEAASIAALRGLRPAQSTEGGRVDQLVEVAMSVYSRVSWSPSMPEPPGNEVASFD